MFGWLTAAAEHPIWHDNRVLPLLRAIVSLLSDLFRLGVLFLRSSNAVRAENLLLRKQLAWYIERGIKPRRVDHATRVGLAVFSRLCDWRQSPSLPARGKNKPPFSPSGKLACGQSAVNHASRRSDARNFGDFPGHSPLQAPPIGAVLPLARVRGERAPRLRG
jgi:hypothetical protein